MAIAPRVGSVTLSIRLLKTGIAVDDAFRDTSALDEVDWPAAGFIDTELRCSA